MAEVQRGEPVAMTVKQVLLKQLQSIESNRAGWCRDQDPDALHDFRVAVRRSRTLVAELADVFPELAEYRSDFSWLGEITGPLRDLDVQLSVLADLQEQNAKVDSAAVKALQILLLTAQQRLDCQLQQQLQGSRCRAFLLNWHDFLSGWQAVAAEKQPFLTTIVDRRIDKRLRQLLGKGARLNEQSSDSKFHRLRVCGKKLRYLLEFFAELYPPEMVGQMGIDLKKLQTDLGLYQDCSVGRNWLRQLNSDLAPTEFRSLDNLFRTHQRKCRETILNRFADFSGSQSCQQLIKLLES